MVNFIAVFALSFCLFLNLFESVRLHYTGSNGKINKNESFLNKKLKEKLCSSIFYFYFNIYR